MRFLSGAFVVIAFALLMFGSHRVVATFFLFMVILWHGVELAVGGGDPRNKQ
jgi:hypothetical protein